MISIDHLRNFYPEPIRNDPRYFKYMLKEYILISILDYLSTTPFIRKLSFIGGTCIRLIKGIDRFSEDLDFECKDFTQQDFEIMTTAIHRFLLNSGYRAVIRQVQKPGLKAFRSSMYFPELLLEIGLSGHKEERFMIKVEAEDQKIPYESRFTFIKGFGFYCAIPVPPDSILCSMKISAMLNRKKGRDFYDVMFLLSLTAPDYSFLLSACGINNKDQLKAAVDRMVSSLDLEEKRKDFEHLLFNRSHSYRILHVTQFFNEL